MGKQADTEHWVAYSFAEAYRREYNKKLLVKEPLPPQADSADFCLLDPHGSEIRVQVCSAEDRDDLEGHAVAKKLEQKISDMLRLHGYVFSMEVGCSRRPTKQDSSIWEEALLRMARRHARSSSGETLVSLDTPGSPLAGTPFEWVRLYANGLPACNVRFLHESLRDPVAAIQKAIDKKVGKKYSDAASLWLLLHAHSPALTCLELSARRHKLRNMDAFEKVWYMFSRWVGLGSEKCEVEICCLKD